ncbi:MAG: DUF4272 domain-containing protein [Lachnospiraceae bacterium]|nr:DUF4272 domain-containing protein [Lachnospiraceae bacterium]
MMQERKMFLYTAIDSLQVVMDSLCRNFGIRSNRRTNRIEVQNGNITMSVTIMCTDMGEKAQGLIKEQVGELWQKFYQVETEYTDLKINLLHQIRQTRGILAIEYRCPKEGEEEKAVFQAFFPILNRIQGIMWVPGEKEAGIYSADERGEKALLLSLEGKSRIGEFMPYPGRPAALPEDINQGQIKRRNRSQEILKERGIYVPAHYPFLESGLQLKVRSPREIAERAAALLTVALYSECMLSEKQTPAQAMEFVKGVIEDMGEGIFSPKEWEYLHNPDSTEEERIGFSWQYENLHVMEWALGLTFDLGFPTCTCDVSKAVSLLKDCHSIEDILNLSHPKSKKELLDACDLIFCLDWACVDARINQLPMPGKLDGGVVMERHKSLNWLTGSQNGEPWDQVKTHT